MNEVTAILNQQAATNYSLLILPTSLLEIAYDCALRKNLTKAELMAHTFQRRAMGE